MTPLRSLLLSALALLLVFFTLEVFFQTTHFLGARISWSVPDPELGWRFAPSRTFWSRDENPEAVTWKTNRYGWKDSEWLSQKSQGKTRIAVLGDSYAEALQVAPEKNFIALAASAMPDTDWLNFGRAGFTQSEEWLVLQKDILPLKPDVLILFFFPVNDISDISPQTTADPTRPFFTENGNSLMLDTSFNKTKEYKLKKWLSPIKNRSALVSLITQRLTLLKFQKSLKKNLEKSSLQTTGGYLGLAAKTASPDFEKNYALNKKLILKIARLCKKNSIRFILASIDLPAYRSEINKKISREFPHFDPLFFDKDLESFSQKNGFEFLGLHGIFAEHYKKTGTLLHWPYYDFHSGQQLEWAAHSGHWNHEGHALTAKTLVDYLRDSKN